MSDGRYTMRQEENGTWTVFDTELPPSSENRIMYGITHERARQYVEHLNKARFKDKVEGYSPQPPTEDLY